jgi:hypothetical protein
MRRNFPDCFRPSSSVSGRRQTACFRLSAPQVSARRSHDALTPFHIPPTHPHSPGHPGSCPPGAGLFAARTPPPKPVYFSQAGAEWHGRPRRGFIRRGRRRWGGGVWERLPRRSQAKGGGFKWMWRADVPEAPHAASDRIQPTFARSCVSLEAKLQPCSSNGWDRR